MQLKALEIQVQDLDHLGIIAGIVDQMGLVRLIDQALGIHPQQIVSPGQAVKAMILNGLGFVSAPLYLYEGFFEGKATAHLLGEHITPQHLNDDCLGRTLDKVEEYGCSELFSLIAMDAYRVFSLSVRRYHLDSSSFSVHGAYEGDSMGTLQITHGYSKAHRPDLKQFIVELICANDAEVPLALEIASGNQSDKAVFGKRLRSFAQQWDVDGMLVADSALYSAENLEHLGSIKWITRVPLNVGAAEELVHQLDDETFIETKREGYRLSPCCNRYAGVAQRWIVVASDTGRQRELRALNKRLSKQLDKANQHLRKLSRTDFACEADARKQAEKLAQSWSLHTLDSMHVVAKAHYEQAGRPSQGATVSHYTYRISAQVIEDVQAVEGARRKAGRFILATNELDEQVLSHEAVLEDYKGQQAPERGFGLLKDPLFFTSSVFLKTPQRIEALAMIMGLSLMVYTLAQRQLRTALQQAHKTIRNQLKKPTNSPTMRWVFQCFQAIHLLKVNGNDQVSNLTPERIQILKFMGAPCQKYYLLC